MYGSSSFPGRPGGPGGGAGVHPTNNRRQSPALETPLPVFSPPQGPRGQDIMIIWDFQNVRIPNELEPLDVIRCGVRCQRLLKNALAAPQAA